MVEEFTVPITIKAPGDICYKIVHNSIWTHTSESNFIDKLKKGCLAHVDIVLTTNVIQNVRKKKRN